MFKIFVIHILFSIVQIRSDECEFLTKCRCTNFPLFALIDTSYLSKPRSTSNQDLFCTYSSEFSNQTQITTFDQFKYFYYRFRTLTFSNYPLLPTKAFRYVYFESQAVKQTEKINNRNVLVFVNIHQTQSGIFEDINLSDAHDQLMIAFLNSPSLIYANEGLSKLNCYELKFYHTNPQISIDFFSQTQSIHHLIIDNPTFTGFLPSKSQPFTFRLTKLSIKDISVSYLRGKHFPIVFQTLKELILENRAVKNGFRSFNHRELAQCFPELRQLTIYSRSIQHLTKRMFESFVQLEYLILNGITTIENEAFYNLYHLKELKLGEHIHRIDPYAFLNMNTNLLLLNDSLQFELDDQKHFCAFAQFSPGINLKTFVKFPRTLSACSCTLRYLYRHIDKSYLSMTPNCYLNTSLYILAQEERLCYFEERLLQCHVLPNEGITIYGQHYNVSYFYEKQLANQRNYWKLIYHYRYYFLLLIPICCLSCCLMNLIKRKFQTSTYRHLNHLLKRPRANESEQVTNDIIYHRTNGHDDLQCSIVPASTKV